MKQLSVKPGLTGPYTQNLSNKFLFPTKARTAMVSSVVLLSVAGLSAVLSSAKWGIAIFAWIAPVCWLLFFRISPVKKKWFWFFPFYFFTSLTISYNVAPFPMPVLVILAVLEALKNGIVFSADRWLLKRSQGFTAGLFFPSAMVGLEYLNSRLGGGVWWSVANSQFDFKWLIQWSSVTGLWGISFLIFWFASVLVWAIQARNRKRPVSKGLFIYFGVLTMVLAFGALRYSIPVGDSRKVKVAGLSVPSMPFLENLYKDYCGKSIVIDPRTSISSPKLQEINRAQLPFIENADTIRFKNGYDAMNKINDSLFKLSQRAASGGAKIIVWSEANAIVFKNGEPALIERGREFAGKNKVFLLMAVAAIHPGKIGAGTKFLENQAIFIGPNGRVLNVFHKNNPVPFAEASIPGDGLIPVLQTDYGNISTSICYDADFPEQMRQLSKNKTELLLLPSGDWFAIAPYHTKMAIFRAVENGTSIVRQVSGGWSAASDYRGRIQASMDFFAPGEKFWMHDVTLGHVPTIYAQIGDSFAYVCLLFVPLMLIRGWKKRKNIPSVG